MPVGTLPSSIEFRICADRDTSRDQAIGRWSSITHDNIIDAMRKYKQQITKRTTTVSLYKCIINTYTHLMLRLLPLQLTAHQLTVVLLYTHEPLGAPVIWGVSDAYTHLDYFSLPIHNCWRPHKRLLPASLLVPHLLTHPMAHLIYIM